MIRARPYPEDARLAVVEASTLEELQAATGALVHTHQADPDWPLSAVVPAERVRQLLAENVMRLQVFEAASSTVDASRTAFAESIADQLPGTIRRGSRVHVGEVAFDIKNTPTIRRKSKSSRGELLRRIEHAASSLAELHAELFRDHSTQANDVLAMKQAAKRLQARLTSHELPHAEIGLHLDALALALSGVLEHVAAISELHPTELRRPPLPHGRVLRNVLFDAYCGSGLPVPDREAFAEQLEWLLGKAGLKSSVEKLIDEMDEYKP